jgi:putative transposase
VDELVTDHTLYLGMARDAEERRASYRKLFRTQLDEEALDEIRKVTNQGLPLGNDRFREQVEVALGRKVSLGQRGRKATSQDVALPGQMGLDI